MSGHGFSGLMWSRVSGEMPPQSLRPAARRRLADPDEDAGGERDRELAREGDRLEAPRRHLVRRPVVGHSAREEAIGDRLEHEPHADVDLAEGGQVALAHHAGIRVWEQRCLGEHARADGAEIPERRAVAVAPEELAVLREDGLRLVAEGEERLLRAEPAAGLRERDDLVGCQRPRAGLAWIAAERAVAAVVAAQRGERHEDLRRERHRASSAPVAHLRGAREELVERRGRRLDEPARLGVGDHARVLRLRPLARTIVGRVTARLVGGTASARTTFDRVTARLVGGTASARTTFGRTSSAKRSMLASTWPDSWWVGSKTKWET